MLCQYSFSQKLLYTFLGVETKMDSWNRRDLDANVVIQQLLGNVPLRTFFHCSQPPLIQPGKDKSYNQQDFLREQNGLVFIYSNLMIECCKQKY